MECQWWQSAFYLWWPYLQHLANLNKLEGPTQLLLPESNGHIREDRYGSAVHHHRWKAYHASYRRDMHSRCYLSGDIYDNFAGFNDTEQSLICHLANNTIIVYTKYRWCELGYRTSRRTWSRSSEASLPSRWSFFIHSKLAREANNGMCIPLDISAEWNS